jgi:hypothetical protein
MYRNALGGDRVARRGLTREWSIDLDPTFDGRVVDGDLQLMSVDPHVRTIWLSIWSPPATESVDDLLRGIRDDAHPNPVQRYSEGGSDEHEQRFASWYAENVDGRRQWGLYAYTVRPGTFVQAAFLTDYESDLDWALEAWRSLRWTQPD